MIDRVYLKAEGLKRKLSSILPSISDNLSKEEVEKRWIYYAPEEKPVFAVAEDGSVNKKHYLGFYLFSVAGFAFGQDRDKNEYYSEVAEVQISVIKASERVDSYFSLLMFLCELKALIKLAKEVKPELLILDGTLTSKFIVSAPKTNWFTKREFSGKLAELSGKLIKEIKPVLYKYDIASFSDEITQKAVEKISQELNEKPKRDILEAVLSKLAYFEYFLLLYDLFYNLDWHPYIVGVAKTSNDTEIFHSPIPDLRIFYKYIDKTGYSIPHTVSFESKAKAKTQEWEFSEVFEKKEKEVAYALKEVSIKYFYSKYKDARNISLIEVYQDPEKEEISPEKIINYLSYLSPIGYPFHLIKADKSVRITANDMKLIEDILQLRYQITGREELF